MAISPMTPDTETDLDLSDRHKNHTIIPSDEVIDMSNSTKYWVDEKEIKIGKFEYSSKLQRNSWEDPF